MLGNGHVEVLCIDGKIRVCHIRGKLRKKVWINNGDIILLGLRDYEDGKGDIILKYTPDEARNLKTYGELPEASTCGASFFCISLPASLSHAIAHLQRKSTSPRMRARRTTTLCSTTWTTTKRTMCVLCIACVVPLMSELTRAVPCSSDGPLRRGVWCVGHVSARLCVCVCVCALASQPMRLIGGTWLT